MKTVDIRKPDYEEPLTMMVNMDSAAVVCTSQNEDTNEYDLF